MNLYCVTSVCSMCGVEYRRSLVISPQGLLSAFNKILLRGTYRLFWINKQFGWDLQRFFPGCCCYILMYALCLHTEKIFALNFIIVFEEITLNLIGYHVEQLKRWSFINGLSQLCNDLNSFVLSLWREKQMKCKCIDDVVTPNLSISCGWECLVKPPATAFYQSNNRTSQCSFWVFCLDQYNREQLQFIKNCSFNFNRIIWKIVETDIIGEQRFYSLFIRVEYNI